MHRNLNVRVNNERGWDYTGANTPADVGDGAPGGAPPVASAGGINGLAVGLEDAPSGARHPGSRCLLASPARQPWVRVVASRRPFCWAAEVALRGRLPGCCGSAGCGDGGAEARCQGRG